MILYENLLEDYIELSKEFYIEKTKDKKMKFTDFIKKFVQLISMYINHGAEEIVAMIFLSIYIFLFQNKCIIWLVWLILLVIGVVLLIISSTYQNRKIELRKNSEEFINRLIEEIIQKDRSWKVEECIDDVIKWCKKESKKTPGWCADLKLLLKPIFVVALLISQKWAEIAKFFIDENIDKMSIVEFAFVFFNAFFMLYALAYALKGPIVSIVYHKQDCAKCFAEDLKCAKIIMANSSQSENEEKQESLHRK